MSKPEKLYRAIEVVREKAENGEEKLSLSVSSETPCLQRVYYKDRLQYGNVILSHSEEAVDKTYIQDGIVLRDNHKDFWTGDGGEVIGRALGVEVKDGKLRASNIVWSASERAQILKTDVENGVRREMSIEATFNEKDMEQLDKGDPDNGTYPTFRVKRWTPLAAAFVPVPADPSVGINRGAETLNDVPKTDTGKETETAPASTQPNPPAEQSAERRKMPEDKTAGIPAETIVRIKDEIKEELKRESVAAEIEAKRAAAPKPEAPKELGLDEKEIADYSIARAIQAKIDGRDCKELEISREAGKKLNKEIRGIYIPEEVLTKRAFDTVAGAGLIGTEHRAQDFITILRNNLIFDRLGIQVLPGLRGNVSIPKQTGAASILTTASREFTVATPGSETYAELIAAEGMVLGKGLSGIKWAVSGKALTALRSLLKNTYGSEYLASLRNDIEGEILGRTALFTDDIQDKFGFIGDFSQVFFGMWGGLDLVVDPYTEAPSGTVRVVAHQDVDFAVRHSNAFAFSNDLTA